VLSEGEEIVKGLTLLAEFYGKLADGACTGHGFGEELPEDWELTISVRGQTPLCRKCPEPACMQRATGCRISCKSWVARQTPLVPVSCLRAHSRDFCGSMIHLVNSLGDNNQGTPSLSLPPLSLARSRSLSHTHTWQVEGNFYSCPGCQATQQERWCTVHCTCAVSSHACLSARLSSSRLQRDQGVSPDRDSIYYTCCATHAMPLRQRTCTTSATPASSHLCRTQPTSKALLHSLLNCLGSFATFVLFSSNPSLHANGVSEAAKEHTTRPSHPHRLAHHVRPEDC
jgi:hypothetical protein